MKKLLLALLISLVPSIVWAQSQRNPCVYISTTIQTCVPVGNGLGIGTAPMPVGGLANASAPTYVEGQPGQLSFDLSGNLRVITSSSGSSTVNQGNAGTNAQAWWTRIGDTANGPVKVQPASTTPGATDLALTASLSPNSNGIITTGTAGTPSSQVITTQGPASNGTYPTAATPIAGNATGTTGSVVGTLAGTSAKTTYICDFDVSAIGGTAAVGPIVVAGLLGGSKTYQLSSSAAGVYLSKSFNPCIPASAVNTAITITTTADGTATAVDVNSSGYQQ